MKKELIWLGLITSTPSHGNVFKSITKATGKAASAVAKTTGKAVKTAGKATGKAASAVGKTAQKAASGLTNCPDITSILCHEAVNPGTPYQAPDGRSYSLQNQQGQDGNSHVAYPLSVTQIYAVSQGGKWSDLKEVPQCRPCESKDTNAHCQPIHSIEAAQNFCKPFGGIYHISQKLSPFNHLANLSFQARELPYEGVKFINKNQKLIAAMGPETAPALAFSKGVEGINSLAGDSILNLGTQGKRASMDRFLTKPPQEPEQKTPPLAQGQTAAPTTPQTENQQNLSKTTPPSIDGAPKEAPPSQRWDWEESMERPNPQGGEESLQSPGTQPNQDGSLQSPGTQPNQDESLQSPGTQPNQGGNLQSPGTQPNQDESLQSPGTQPNQGGNLQSPGTQPNQDESLQSPGTQPNQGGNPQSPGTQPNQDGSLQSPGTQPNQDESLQSPGTQPNQGGNPQSPGTQPNP